MNDRAYPNDLGGGVYEDDEPVERTHRPVSRCPTCPHCGSNDSAAHVHHPQGEWWCPVCSYLFSGSDHEWHVLSKKRKRAIEKRAQAQTKEAG